VRQLLQFARRNGMDIEGLGDAIAEELTDAEVVSTLPDLYRLTKEALLIARPSTGKTKTPKKTEGKWADNLLTNIAASKDRGLARLLSAMSIPMVAESVADDLAQHFLTMEALLAATPTQLTEVDGIATERARAIHNYLHLPSTLQTIDEFRELGLKLSEERRTVSAPASGGGGIIGKTIVVTGSLQKYDRNEIEDVIKKHGGKPSGSVSKKTDFLLAGAEAGSKKTKAEELGVRILTEAEFLAMIGE
ncbi:MAG: helix-hairpin-helix domain-containing protein, partial [Gemmataceae bacterium]